MTEHQTSRGMERAEERCKMESVWKELKKGARWRVTLILFHN
jgi:hypothetical protein